MKTKTRYREFVEVVADYRLNENDEAVAISEQFLCALRAKITATSFEETKSLLTNTIQNSLESEMFDNLENDLILLRTFREINGRAAFKVRVKPV